MDEYTLPYPGKTARTRSVGVIYSPKCDWALVSVLNKIANSYSRLSSLNSISTTVSASREPIGGLATHRLIIALVPNGVYAATDKRRGLMGVRPQAPAGETFTSGQ